MSLSIETYALSKGYTDKEISKIAGGGALEKDPIYLADKPNIATKKDLEQKQNKLTAGSNIEIQDDTISANIVFPEETDPVYLADKPTLATKEEVGNKQNKLIAGDNIDITDDTISVTLTIPEESDPVYLSERDTLATKVEIGNKQDKLTAGENITIENNTISANVGVLKEADPVYTADKPNLATKAELNNKQNKLVAGENITIEGDTISVSPQVFSETDPVYTADKPNIALKSDLPTNVSQLQNDAGYLTDFTEQDPTVPQHVKNITTDDITEWNSKSTFSGNYNDLSHKPTIPSNTSDLTNDSGFVTDTYVQNQFTNFQIVSVETELPQSGEPNKIYLVPKLNPTSKDLFDEYIWVNSQWEWVTSSVFKFDETPTTDSTNLVNSGNIKKYVDNQVANSGHMNKSEYDSNADGVVDNAERLGGELPEHYATKQYVDENKAPTIIVDSAMSDSSTNPVQNKIVKQYIDSRPTGSGDMAKTTYDINDNGIVDDAEKLGGHLPSYYATQEYVDGLGFTVDDHMDDNSTNTVQNKVLKKYVDESNESMKAYDIEYKAVPITQTADMKGPQFHKDLDGSSFILNGIASDIQFHDELNAKTILSKDKILYVHTRASNSVLAYDINNAPSYYTIQLPYNKVSELIHMTEMNNKMYFIYSDVETAYMYISVYNPLTHSIEQTAPVCAEVAISIAAQPIIDRYSGSEPNQIMIAYSTKKNASLCVFNTDKMSIEGEIKEFNATPVTHIQMSLGEWDGAIISEDVSNSEKHYLTSVDSMGNINQPTKLMEAMKSPQLLATDYEMLLLFIDASQAASPVAKVARLDTYSGEIREPNTIAFDVNTISGTVLYRNEGRMSVPFAVYVLCGNKHGNRYTACVLDNGARIQEITHTQDFHSVDSLLISNGQNIDNNTEHYLYIVSDINDTKCLHECDITPKNYACNYKIDFDIPHLPDNTAINVQTNSVQLDSFTHLGSVPVDSIIQADCVVGGFDDGSIVVSSRGANNTEPYITGIFDNKGKAISDFTPTKPLIGLTESSANFEPSRVHVRDDIAIIYGRIYQNSTEMFGYFVINNKGVVYKQFTQLNSQSSVVKFVNVGEYVAIISYNYMHILNMQGDLIYIHSGNYEIDNNIFVEYDATHLEMIYHKDPLFESGTNTTKIIPLYYKIINVLTGAIEGDYSFPALLNTAYFAGYKVVDPKTKQDVLILLTDTRPTSTSNYNNPIRVTKLTLDGEIIQTRILPVDKIHKIDLACFLYSPNINPNKLLVLFDLSPRRTKQVCMSSIDIRDLALGLRKSVYNNPGNYDHIPLYTLSGNHILILNGYRGITHDTFSYRGFTTQQDMTESDSIIETQLNGIKTDILASDNTMYGAIKRPVIVLNKYVPSEPVWHKIPYLAWGEDRSVYPVQDMGDYKLVDFVDKRDQEAAYELYQSLPIGTKFRAKANGDKDYQYAVLMQKNKVIRASDPANPVEYHYDLYVPSKYMPYGSTSFAYNGEYSTIMSNEEFKPLINSDTLDWSLNKTISGLGVGFGNAAIEAGSIDHQMTPVNDLSVKLCRGDWVLKYELMLDVGGIVSPNAPLTKKYIYTGILPDETLEQVFVDKSQFILGLNNNVEQPEQKLSLTTIAHQEDIKIHVSDNIQNYKVGLYLTTSSATIVADIIPAKIVAMPACLI